MNTKRKFTNEQELEIVHLYTQGLSTKKLSLSYGCRVETIIVILKRNNVKIKTAGQLNRKFNLEIELKICSEYLDGLNSVELSKKYDCSVCAIMGILERNKIKKRNQSEACRKYSLDESVFDVITEGYQTWLLGWWYSDGCNLNKTNCISIGLSKIDKPILEIMCKYFKISVDKINNNPEKNMKDKNGNPMLRKTDGLPMVSKPMSVLSMNSKHMSGALTRLGCVSSKSLILKWPTEEQVPEHLLSHFIRAYFEGDGSICFSSQTNNNRSYSLGLTITGTEQFLEGMKNWLLTNGLESISLKEIDEESESNTWSLKISSILDVLKFKKLIYDNYFKEHSNGDLYLQRKWNKFLEIQQWCDNNPEFIFRLQNLRYLSTPEGVSQVINLYKIRNYSSNKISSFFNVCPLLILNILENSNIIRRNSSESKLVNYIDKPKLSLVSKNIQNKICSDYSNNCIPELTVKYKISNPTIRRILIENNIQLRTKSEANLLRYKKKKDV